MDAGAASGSNSERCMLLTALLLQDAVLCGRGGRGGGMMGGGMMGGGMMGGGQNYNITPEEIDKDQRQE